MYRRYVVLYNIQTRTQSEYIYQSKPPHKFLHSQKHVITTNPWSIGFIEAHTVRTFLILRCSLRNLLIKVKRTYALYSQHATLLHTFSISSAYALTKQNCTLELRWKFQIFGMMMRKFSTWKLKVCIWQILLYEASQKHNAFDRLDCLNSKYLA